MSRLVRALGRAALPMLVLLSLALVAPGCAGGDRHDHSHEDGHGDDHPDEEAAHGPHGENQGDDHGDDRVEIGAEALAASGIEVAIAAPATVRTTLTLPGQIAPNADRVAQVLARLSGVLTEAPRTLGDRVKAGDVLAVLDSRELADAKSDYIESIHTLEYAQSVFVREERLWQRKILAGERLPARQEQARGGGYREADRRAEAAGAGRGARHAERARGRARRRGGGPPGAGAVPSPRAHPLRGPRADRGHHHRADALPGAGRATRYGALHRRRSLHRLGRGGGLRARLALVRTGLPAVVRARALGLEATGTVTYVGALVGEHTRSATARVVLSNPEGRWRPGCSSRPSVEARTCTVPVAVPLDAHPDGARLHVVFVAGDVFEARPVELGRRDERSVEVVSRPAAGERYAAAHSFVLKAELGKSGASHDH